MAKRKFFTELMEGVAAMQAKREGGLLTLRSHKMKPEKLSIKPHTSLVKAFTGKPGQFA